MALGVETARQYLGLAMSFTATVENGVIRLPDGVSLPNGAQVRVEPIQLPANELTRRLTEIAATVEGLPSDLAAEHDHYIHGTPKRKTS
jgi:hypothetical protein